MNRPRPVQTRRERREQRRIIRDRFEAAVERLKPVAFELDDESEPGKLHLTLMANDGFVERHRLTYSRADWLVGRCATVEHLRRML